MVGTTVSHYRVLQLLGAGGMGIVYLADDERLRRKVALKFLPPAVASNSQARARFTREAQAASALDHPNIATIYEIGEWNGQLFIAMAYYEGETLKQRIDRGPMELREVASVLADLGSGLTAAHAAGIVHRDLKPANIILTPAGQAKILDFGLAKLLPENQETAAGITGAGTTVGTVAYMAPEQARGQVVDQRADLWALGVLLYEMLTGALPFKAESAAAMLLAVQTEKPAPLREHRPDVPPEIERIVGQALQRDCTARTITAAEIVQEVAAYRARASSGTLGAASVPVPWAWLRRRRVAIPAAVVLLMLGSLGAWAFNRSAKVRWARDQAVPEILRFRDEGKLFEAFDLAKQAETYLGNNPVLSRLWPNISRRLSVQSTPPGADVSFADYNSATPRWEHVGRSPFNDARVPTGVALRLRIEKSGVATIDDVVGVGGGSVSRSFTMDAPDVVPLGMVRVQGDEVPATIFVPGLDHLSPIQLASFWIDRYEVSNKQFKEFVDAGGYRTRDFWRQDFVKDGRRISWEEAIATFHDSTGRPGPSAWELGDYPQGQEAHPVTGVSWYEAAAYAEFAGKAVPTVFHWSRAAAQNLSGSVVPVSNFSGRGPAPVGSHRGMHRFGTYDMAGNVKEWCWNLADAGKRYILGGAWDEPVYMFTDAEARSPFDREATFGFRCVKYIGDDPLPAAATAMLEFPSRDYSKEKPVSDEVFGAYARMYSYDNTDLKPVLEQADDSSPDWKREKITFAAAYGGERMSAYLFVPKGYTPPYQTVMYFPGSNALHQRSSEVDFGGRPGFDFLIKSGRAVMVPIYKSTYERGDGLESDYPNMTTTWRDHVVAWSKDLGRSIDYLETRPDIAHDKLGYYGVSWGAQMGAILPAVEPRLRVSLLIVGGFSIQRALPEVEPINFTPRITLPTLMLNGRYDFFYPTVTSQEPMFRFLGAPAEHKRRVVYETGHNIPRPELIKETLNWLDKYLGPVK
jgi:dienelactone hydrolase/predicted Ser/Thr protein kinase